MEILVDIVDDNALCLLRDMEVLNLIQLKIPVIEKQKHKLSDKFAGALHLSDEQYENFQAAIKMDRDNWK
ncbi:hypothetical protein FACS1894164_00160 [Spirochaetia bacterium]|nr:hypothetical protein FACS1894164_00160 [Spirochaetia bacterium]